LKVAFRVDASIEIGTGHVMRCLTLASALQEGGAEIFFVSREIKGHLIHYIEEKGFKVVPITYKGVYQETLDTQVTIHALRNREIDWVVVDHYQIDEKWEKKIKTYTQYILCIDDLANRKHICDILLDQNYLKNYKTRYDHLLPNDCLKLLGPHYCLLRSEFIEACSEHRNRTGQIKKILVFFGGSDPTNESSKAIKALSEVNLSGIDVDVVVGSSNPNIAVIKDLCDELEYNFHCQINYLAKLMKEADLSLGAGGVTMWERCFLGLPSIVVIVAENQKETTEATADFGAIWSLGWYDGVNISNLVDKIKEALYFPHKLKTMSERAMQLMSSDKAVRIGNIIKKMEEIQRR
jgi:UDP-2,4-diacetamido-2,4,6-trideoxy-beta-L-altropyranose hydrolase